jgi:GrpB-like predicted nucleotidyltransferase (UPF0157 family)
VTQPISIEPYDPAWAGRFETERELLEQVLAPWLDEGIQHVGSTAVPGLAAKPIIDMIAGVHDLAEAQSAFAPLHEHSYEHTPHRPGIAHHFDRASPRCGLHLTEPGSDLWVERLAFRDALRADADLAVEYESLKRRLATDHPADIAAYTAGKRDFVVRVLASAGVALGRG